MLWLAIHFPDLALDLAGDSIGAGQALAIEQAQAAVHRIVACNAAAREVGVKPGQPLQAALALCGELRVLTRKPEAEHAALERLAAWALRYTSLVHVSAPCTLLLEVGASRQLFGGLVPLCQRVVHELAGMGYTARAAVAPTPAGARLLAWTGVRRIVRGLPALETALRSLDLQPAELPDETIAGLAGIGVRDFQRLLDLPRAELARRFGAPLIDYLDRLLGRRPEPLTPFRLPENFRAQVELPYHVTHTDGLQFTLRRLLRELGAWLIARQLALLRAELSLVHEPERHAAAVAPIKPLHSQPPLPLMSDPFAATRIAEPPPPISVHAGTARSTTVVLGLMQASADAEHLFGLLRAQLERVSLPAAVVSLVLQASQCVPLNGANRDLFARDNEQGDMARVIERLRSRLGADAVQLLQVAEDHRPELASRSATAEQAPPTSASDLRPRLRRLMPEPDVPEEPPPPRPLYLLHPPQPLSQWREIDWSAATMDGGERIETGWWDEAHVMRDYLRLRTEDGVMLWVYRERVPTAQWFVHGVFA